MTYLDDAALLHAARSTLPSLQQSAALYAEVYDSDPELQELVEAGLADWPE